MAPSDSTDSGPLSAAERNQLTELLTHTTWDIHGLLGILSAVAIAPRDVGFGEWMLVVAPRPKGLMVFERTEDAEDFLGLVMRFNDDVLGALDAGKLAVPAAEATDARASFAKGFAAGVALDPSWTGAADLLHGDAAEAIVTAYRTSPKSRKRAGGGAPAGGGTVVRSGPRVGRNDPCPCGSGKKFKHCCINGQKPPLPN